MRSAAVLSVFAAAFCSCGAVADNAGVRGTLSQPGLTYLAAQAKKLLLDKFSTFTVSGMETEHDSVTVTVGEVTCSGLQVADLDFQVVPNTGIQGVISGLYIDCTASCKAREDVWPHPEVSGTCEVKAESGTASITLDVGRNATNGKPTVSAPEVKVSLGELKIELHGSFWSWLVNFFLGLFEGSIKDEIESKIGPVVQNDFIPMLNGMLQNVSLDIPLPFNPPYDIAAVRFGLTSAPTFGKDYAAFDLQGDVYDIRYPAAKQPFTPPPIPQTSNLSASHYLAGFLSAYTLETAVYVFQHANLLQLPVNHDVIPAGFPAALNTSWLALAAPELSSLYPNMWVDLNVSLTSNVTVDFNASPAKFIAPVDLRFTVEDTAKSGPAGWAPEPIFTLGCDMSTALSIGISRDGYNQTLQGNLSYLDCPLELVSSQVGTVKFSLLKDLVNFLLQDVVLPAANILFQAGLPLPNAVGLNLTDTYVGFDQGFVELASDFTWNPLAN